MQETIVQTMTLLTPQLSLLLYSGYVLGPMIVISANIARCFPQYSNTSTKKTIIVCVAVIGYMIWTASLIYYNSS